MVLQPELRPENLFEVTPKRQKASLKYVGIVLSERLLSLETLP